MVIREIYITKRDYLRVHTAYRRRCSNARKAGPNQTELRRDEDLCDFVEKDITRLNDLFGNAKDKLDRRLCEKKIPIKIKNWLLHNKEHSYRDAEQLIQSKIWAAVIKKLAFNGHFMFNVGNWADKLST